MAKNHLRVSALLLAFVFLFGAVLFVSPVKVNAAEGEYTVSGVWVFNDVLVTKSSFMNIQFAVNFISSNTEYSKISLLSSVGSTPVSYNLRFWSENGFLSACSRPSSDIGWIWVDESYKVVDFGSEPQVVDEAFYDFLTTNATFTPPPLEVGPLVEVVTDLTEREILTQVMAQIVNLIPIMMVFLLSYKGFWKALALLRRILRQS